MTHIPSPYLLSPMAFFSLVFETLRTGTASASIPLFLASALLLLVGVAVHARSRVRLHHLEDAPLSKIEFTHPHLPSARAVGTVVLCGTTLLLAGLQTVEGVFPFNDPYQGLNLVSLFLIATAVGVLAELEWAGATSYTSAALVGTALAFLVLTVHFARAAGSVTTSVVTIALLMLCLLLAGWSLAAERRDAVLLTLFLTFAFWILVGLLQTP
jgi:hypothetical protein